MAMSIVSQHEWFGLFALQKKREAFFSGVPSVLLFSVRIDPQCREERRILSSCQCRKNVNRRLYRRAFRRSFSSHARTRRTDSLTGVSKGNTADRKTFETLRIENDHRSTANFFFVELTTFLESPTEKCTSHPYLIHYLARTRHSHSISFLSFAWMLEKWSLTRVTRPSLRAALTHAVAISLYVSSGAVQHQGRERREPKSREPVCVLSEDSFE